MNMIGYLSGTDITFPQYSELQKIRTNEVLFDRKDVKGSRNVTQELKEASAETNVEEVKEDVAQKVVKLTKRGKKLYKKLADRERIYEISAGGLNLQNTMFSVISSGTE